MARKKESLQDDAKLDMTPITDCAFLLLIFFMVTTVFKNPSQLKLTLPEVNKAAELEKKQIVVELTADGSMAIQGKPFSYDQFDAYLIAEKQKSQINSVLIRADKEAKHGEVLKLMKLAKSVAIETIAMQVEDLSIKQGQTQ
jgi:biopolymer transport protein ExbD